MLKIFNRIASKLQDVLYAVEWRRLKKHFFFEDGMEISFPDTCTVSKLFENYIFKDESWNYVKHLYEYRKSMRTNHPITFENNFCKEEEKIIRTENGVDISSSPREDNWVMLMNQEDYGYPYRLSFDLVINNVFKEIQVAFWYKDLGNRCRFLIRNNEMLNFECVYRGEFFNHIYQKPFSLKIGQKHHFVITVDHFICGISIDGKQLMRVQSDMKPFGYGKAMIFYQPDDSMPICCRVEDAVLQTIPQ